MAGTYDDLSFGQVALALGYVKPEQLREFLKIQADYSTFKGQAVPLGQIMKEAGAIDTRALNHILSELGQARDDRTVHVQRLIMVCRPCGKRYSLPLEYRDRTVNCKSCLAPLELEHKPTTDRAAEEDVPTEVRVCARDTSNLFGHYTLIREIGRGGMGVVYKAWDNTLKRYVALKFLQSASLEDIKRFEREAQALAKLNHPNIAQVYEIGTVAGKFFIALQFIDGGSLGAARLSQTELLQKMIDVCYAIDYAHKHNIQHRDLKPSNLMVDRDGRVFVMDFGLAKQLKGRDLELSHTRQIVGTPQFMSPEQARGEKTDARSDVYSLGATLYTLLTRVYPHDGKSMFAVLKHVVEKDVIPPRSFNPRVTWELETIILKAMEKDPLRRYQTARELAEDLRRYLSGEPILARRPTLTYRIKKTVARHKTATLAAVLIVLLAAGVIGLGITARGVKEELTETKSTVKEQELLLTRQKHAAAQVALMASEAAKVVSDFDNAVLAPEIDIERWKQELPEAAAKLKRAIALAESSGLQGLPLANLYTELGRVHARRDDYDAALQAFERSLRIFESGAAHYERGLTYVLMAHAEEGRRFLGKPTGEDESARTRINELAGLASQDFQACQQYPDLREEAYKLEYARFLADVLGLERKNPDDLLARAEKVLDLIRTTNPRLKADLLEQMSALYAAKGDYAHAIEAIDKAAEIKRSDYRAHRSRAFLHYGIASIHYDRALKTYALAPDQALADIESLALPELKTGIDKISAAVTLRPDMPDTWLMRAVGYHLRVLFSEVVNRVSEEDIRLAIADLTRALKLNDALVEARMMRGHLSYMLGRHLWKRKQNGLPELDRAIEDFTEGLRRKASPAGYGLRCEALYLKSILLAESGQPVQETIQAALKDADRMMSDSPNPSAARMMRGKIRLVQAQFALARSGTLPETELKQAWEEFDAAFKAKRDNWEALAYRGAVEFYLDQPKAAEADLREAFRNKPLLQRAEFGRIYEQVLDRLRRF